MIKSSYNQIWQKDSANKYTNYTDQESLIYIIFYEIY